MYVPFDFASSILSMPDDLVFAMQLAIMTEAVVIGTALLTAMAESGYAGSQFRLAVWYEQAWFGTPSMIDITSSANLSRRRRRFASSSSSPDARASAPRADARMRAMRTVAPARPRPALAFARPTSARDANARRPNVLVGSTARMKVARGSL